MPKKTRREKIIAQYRQRIKLLENNPKTIKAALPENQVTQTIDKNIKSPINQQEIDRDNESKKYFISDFKKSLFIISLIIALEIGLYFATMIK